MPTSMGCYVESRRKSIQAISKSDRCASLYGAEIFNAEWQKLEAILLENLKVGLVSGEGHSKSLTWETLLWALKWLFNQTIDHTNWTMVWIRQRW